MIVTRPHSGGWPGVPGHLAVRLEDCPSAPGSRQLCGAGTILGSEAAKETATGDVPCPGSTTYGGVGYRRVGTDSDRRGSGSNDHSCHRRAHVHGSAGRHPGRRTQGRRRAGRARGVHRHPVRGDPARDPGRLGRLAGLVRRPHLVRRLRRRRARHHRGLPPLPHPRLVQGQAAAPRRPRRCGKPGDRRTGDPLGGGPPQAPQVLRQGGRPALPVAVRRERAGA